MVGLSREITPGTKMDGYISCCNNSRLFGGNRRVTGLLVQAVIATMAEQATEITLLRETKTSQIEKPRKRTLWCRLHHLIESQSLGNEQRENPQQQALSSEDGDGERGGAAVEVGNMGKR